MRKIHLKRKKKNIKNIILVVVLLLIFVIVIFLNIINTKLTPIFIENAEIVLNKISTIIVNNAVSDALNNSFEETNFVEIIKNEDNEIQLVDFNSLAVNEILSVVTNTIQNDLNYLKNGQIENIKLKDDFIEERLNDLKNGIIVKVPIGSITKNSFLSNLGPKIPIKLSYIGDVNSSIYTNIKQYGINNAMVEVIIKIDIVSQIILPFQVKKMNFSYEVPVVIKMIQGIVPNYYGGDFIRNSELYSTLSN